MSHHYFTTTYQDRELVIGMGWDQPHQAFFMYLQQEGRDEPLWCNLYQPNAFPQTLTSFLTVLADFGLAVPTTMIAAVEQDNLDDIDDKIVHHTQTENFV